MEIGSDGSAVKASGINAQLGTRKPSLFSPLVQARELAKSVCSMVRHQACRLKNVASSHSRSLVYLPAAKFEHDEHADFESYRNSIQAKFKQQVDKGRVFRDGEGQFCNIPIDLDGNIVFARHSNYSRSLTSNSNSSIQGWKQKFWPLSFFVACTQAKKNRESISFSNSSIQGLDQKFSSLSPFDLAALEQSQAHDESPSFYFTADSQSLSPFSSKSSIDEFETQEDQAGSPNAQASPERTTPTNTSDLIKTQAQQRNAFVALLTEDGDITSDDLKSSPVSLTKGPLSPIAEEDETNLVSSKRTGTLSERTAAQLHFVQKMKELEPTKQSLDDPSSKGVYGWGFKILGMTIQDQGLPWNPHEFVKAHPNPDYKNRPPLNYVERAKQAVESKRRSAYCNVGIWPKRRNHHG